MIVASVSTTEKVVKPYSVVCAGKSTISRGGNQYDSTTPKPKINNAPLSIVKYCFL